MEINYVMTERIVVSLAKKKKQRKNTDKCSLKK